MASTLKVACVPVSTDWLLGCWITRRGSTDIEEERFILEMTCSHISRLKNKVIKSRMQDIKGQPDECILRHTCTIICKKKKYLHMLQAKCHRQTCAGSIRQIIPFKLFVVKQPLLQRSLVWGSLGLTLNHCNKPIQRQALTNCKLSFI